MSKTRPHFKVGDRVVDMSMGDNSRAKVIGAEPDDHGGQVIKVHWDGSEENETYSSDNNRFWPASEFVLEDDFDADN